MTYERASFRSKYQPRTAARDLEYYRERKEKKGKESREIRAASPREKERDRRWRRDGGKVPLTDDVY